MRMSSSTVTSTAIMTALVISATRMQLRYLRQNAALLPSGGSSS